MKKQFYKTTLVSAVVASVLFCSSCDKKATVDISLIEDITTVQAFKSDAIPDADISKIVQAGINCQSAINKQPWHFSVVTNKEVLNGIGEKMKANMPKMPPKGASDDMPKPPAGAPKNGAKAAMGDSPVAIIISAKDGGDFDAGLATQLMTVEAVLLGYGTKIISSPSIVLNGSDKAEYQNLLGIPSDMSVKGVILIGNYDKSQADAVTSATTRKNSSEVVSFIK